MNKGGGVYYDSPSDNSLSHFPENFVGYPSLYDKISGDGRFYCMRGISPLSVRWGGGG